MIPGTAYQIVMHELAIEELESERAFEQRRVVAEIRQQLTHEPAVPSRKRKCLVDLTPSFEHEPPIWELRVGNLRVFYDVNQADRRVHVRAVRRKDTQTTEDIV
jgi:mRNA-degrading endonuclease RelE of RelBE toxin-antitoxin system